MERDAKEKSTPVTSRNYIKEEVVNAFKVILQNKNHPEAKVIIDEIQKNRFITL
ncbi:hypothetical protein [Brevibacillus porteri]|uniref:hypothetical protein n=1 Tax=Brevibacillus porteri TaxID=2126350 RepID=UPI001304E0FA|nr:hypothetical protein [Brevibacillus porteri]MED1801317.1 hypothetical protein [Brevibacillus porteri]MED2135024.1 hypothetical protein [Brevibacillus porteri]MED2745121.1 hypothetical protein [Brevibacillus porteri]MED2813414.1 hypothetical protein [Brevibacillus porteri]MED2897989.1 hypothetical protein [Brevibacillus porteri]